MNESTRKFGLTRKKIFFKQTQLYTRHGDNNVSSPLAHSPLRATCLRHRRPRPPVPLGERFRGWVVVALLASDSRACTSEERLLLFLFRSSSISRHEYFHAEATRLVQ